MQELSINLSEYGICLFCQNETIKMVSFRNESTVNFINIPTMVKRDIGMVFFANFQNCLIMAHSISDTVNTPIVNVLKVLVRWDLTQIQRHVI